MHKQQFINSLIYRNEFRFTQLAPNTLMYHDDSDTILIHIDNGGVSIFHDGYEVISSSMEFIFNTNVETPIWEEVIQEILNLF